MSRFIRDNIVSIVLIAIILLATLIRLYNINSIWSYYYHDYDGAFYSIIARNYLRYGWLKINFAQFLDVGPLDPDSVPYANHPPLVPILVSISFKLFGIHEWAARLVPLIFSVGSIIALFFLVSKVWNSRTALFSCLFMSIMPMASYFGSVPTSEASIMLFSFILTTYFYILYTESPKLLYLLLMISAFFLGAITDWPAFYVPLVLTVHYLLFSDKPKENKSFFIFPLFATIVFIFLFFIYVKILTGFYDSIVSKFFFRTGTSISDFELGKSFTFSQWFDKLFSFHRELYTLPVLILSCIWFLNLLYMAVKRKNLKKDGVVVILLSIGLIHIFLGRQGAWIHAYWSAVLIPGLAIASAVSVERIYSLISSHSRRYGMILRSAFFLSIFLYIVYCVLKLHSLNQVQLELPYEYWYRFGTTIKRISNFEDKILTSDDIFYARQLQFYADRNLKGQVTNLNLFYDIYHDNLKKYRYFFLPKDQQMVHRALYEFLDKSFRSKTENGFIIFDLKNKKTDDENIKRYLQAGQYDYYFLDHMKEADIVEEKEGYIRPHNISVDGKPREVIYLHPNSKITFKDIPIRENSSLSSGIGINQLAWNKKGDGVLFKVIATSKGRKSLIFAKYINPKAKLTDRKWHDFTIDLDRFSNQEISITFETEAGPKNNFYFDWAGWSNPQIISRPNKNQKLNQSIKAGVRD